MAARAAGWSFFDVGLGRLQVQRDDECEALASDAAAWEAVVAPSPLNSKALAFLQQNNPGEWLRIVSGGTADERELVLVSAGYRILDNGKGSGWYALLPGAKEFQSADEGSVQGETFLGFFSSKCDLLDDLYARVAQKAMLGASLNDEAWAKLHVDNKMGAAWCLRPVSAPRSCGGRAEGCDF